MKRILILLAVFSVTSCNNTARFTDSEISAIRDQTEVIKEQNKILKELIDVLKSKNKKI